MIAPRSRNVLLLAVAGPVILLAAFAISVSVWLPLVFGAIQHEESAEPSDAILIEGWVVQDRLIKLTAELYHKGYGRVVFTTGGRFERLFDLVGVDNWADATKKQLMVLGVPDERIVPIHQTIEGTYGEIMAARPLFRSYEIGSVIVLSEPTHLWRTCRTYSKATRDMGTRFYCVTHQPQWMKADTWWHTHRGIVMLAQEYASSFYYFLSGYI